MSKETAEHMAKFRVRCNQCSTNFCVNCKIKPYHLGRSCEQAKNFEVARKCRYCWDEMTEPSISPDEAFRDVCRKPDCIALMQKSCNKTHPCGHNCKGFRGESQCLPCIDRGCIEEFNKGRPPQTQMFVDYADTDVCNICWVSGLGDEPSMMLGCRHIFHVVCIEKRIMTKWAPPRITWDFLSCPSCKQEMQIPPSHQKLTSFV